MGIPHAVKNEAIYAYVSVMPGAKCDEALRKEICEQVRHDIGPFATPDVVHWAPALPKTRSGKIMRRILRKIAEHGKNTDVGQLGDVSTLTDPAVVQMLLDTVGK